MKSVWIAFLSICLFSCHGISKVLKSKDAEYKLRMAEKYYVEKKYTYAQQLYEDVIPYFTSQKEYEDIYYKYAYTAYYQKDYLNAENLFKTYLEKFPNSTRAEEIEYMRAYTFYKQSPKPELDQTNTFKTMGMMQTFISTHPGSARNKEATEIIDICRQKLETKDSRSAQLYYNIGQYKAASVAFTSLMNTYPDSQKAEEYKLMSIKSYFKYAEMSVEEKKQERFEKVIEACHEFTDRFPQSQYAKEVAEYITSSQNNLKHLTNEQTKTTT